MSFINGLYNEFYEKYENRDNIHMFFSPGRVNLIGEHLDYNGGYVFPCALNFGTNMLISLRKDKKARFYSTNYSSKGIIEFDITNIKYNKSHGWVNYLKGVILEIIYKGKKIDRGFDVLVSGNIPNGSGLSSSASLEVVMGIAINNCFNLNMSMVSIVKLSQKAENKFIGVNCGIMDQFAVGMGKKDRAILLNCNTLKYEYTKLKLKNIDLIILNTNKKRGLVDSKYNDRRSECELALETIRKIKNIKNLTDMDEREFEKIKYIIKDETIRKRAKHVVYENSRVLKAVNELNDNNIAEFGQLMNYSHLSLKNDYEVTGLELDTLVELAWKHNGVLGARMTGGGFGGCTVNLVKSKDVDSFIEFVSSRYEKIIGYEPSVYKCKIGDGAKEIKQRMN
ncbi:MAG: galactokinase [Clostridiales bacterium]